ARALISRAVRHAPRLRDRDAHPVAGRPPPPVARGAGAQAARGRELTMLLDEPLIFERGSQGRRGWDVPPAPAGDVPTLPAALRREDDLAGLPEVGELEVLRHFVRLSQWNYSAATTLYPLGSCTMKYNPVVNEEAARMTGFARLHPLVPTATAQGMLALL